jgi:acyl-CoA reductase-like NAD-dependent aldehyde dehydrogenase
MTNVLPSGSQALRHFADTLDQQAERLDRLLWRERGQRSTTAEACRTLASLARQQASKRQQLEQQAARAGGRR